MPRNQVQAVLLSLAGAVALAFVVAMATGRLSFVVTHGISMEPTFHTGDLAVLWATGSYHVGQIVAYDSPLLHTIVLHRIHAETNGLFTFKGDNNGFLDPDKLPASYIRGTLILHVPHGGLLYTWLRTPLHALLAVLFVFGLAGTAAVEHRKVGRRARPRALDPAAARALHGTRALIGGAGGVVCCSALLVLGLITPPTKVSFSTVSYAQRLTFSYSASARRSATYPSGTVGIGAPLFLKLVHSLEVHAQYRLTSPTPLTHAAGTIEISAAVEESDGWSHVLATSGPVPFHGPDATATMVLPIGRALALAATASRETGIADGLETIVVTPTASIRGLVAGQPFTGAISSDQTFSFSGFELSLQTNPAASAGGSGLVATRSGSVQSPSVTPGGVVLFGQRLQGRPIVEAGALGMALALALALAGARRRWRGREEGEEARDRRHLRRHLVAIENDPSPGARVVVDVSSLSALAGLADRFDLVILDHLEHGQHVYFAAVGDILYRHRGEGATREEQRDGDIVLLFNAAASGWG